MNSGGTKTAGNCDRGGRMPLGEALAVRNEEKGGAVYRIEPREARFATSASTSGFSLPASRTRSTTAKGTAAAAAGLLPLPVRNAPRARRRSRRAVRDPDDRGAARRRGRAGDRGPGRGLRRPAGRPRAAPASLAALSSGRARWRHATAGAGADGGAGREQKANGAQRPRGRGRCARGRRPREGRGKPTSDYGAGALPDCEEHLAGWSTRTASSGSCHEAPS